MREKEVIELYHVLLHVKFLGFQIYIILGLILSAQPVWEECWVRFLTSRLTHEACARIYVSPAKEPSRAVLASPLCLTFSLPFLRRVGSAQMPRGKERPSQSLAPSLGFPFV